MSAEAAAVLPVVVVVMPPAEALGLPAPPAACWSAARAPSLKMTGPACMLLATSAVDLAVLSLHPLCPTCRTLALPQRWAHQTRWVVAAAAAVLLLLVVAAAAAAAAWRRRSRQRWQQQTMKKSWGSDGWACGVR